ncbi:hypothetical protein [Variovorax sp. DT-64]|uniref:hypothetical protein n=1 Tax=Variovorax sp. DT-64 TaxID=3396160 RepID=UPI003F1DBD50
MAMKEEFSYFKIKTDMLEVCYQYCRSKILASRQWSPGEHEFAFAYEEYRHAFTHPTERLMIEVVALVLAAGRGGAEEFHRSKIANLLEGDGLESLLSFVSIASREEFGSDLKLLNVLS